MDASPEESGEEVILHASGVEPVVELCDVALEVFVVDHAVGSEQEALQVRQRDVGPGKELMRRLVLFGRLDGGMDEAVGLDSQYPFQPSIRT
jgi:hypothetical protein